MGIGVLKIFPIADRLAQEILLGWFTMQNFITESIPNVKLGVQHLNIY